MAQLITKEFRVLTGNLHIILDIHQLFRHHKCDWMSRDPGCHAPSYPLDADMELWTTSDPKLTVLA